MSSDVYQEENLTDHSYDGIQEYDNPLPGWWKWLFVATIFFAPLYYFYYQFGVPGRSIHDQYNDELGRIFTLRFAEIGKLQPDRATILKYMNDPKWRTVGQVVFKTNCVSCHGAEATGKVGPNLTDDYWKNVRKVEDIPKVIAEGAANGAMPAWKNRLSHQNLIVLAAAYVASLREHPLPGKVPEPEAVKLPPWEAIAPSTTK